MPAFTRTELLLETLTVVADTLVDDFDVVEFLHDLVERCAAIFDAVDVGLVLADSHGDLVVMASTSERLHLIEVLQLSAGDGPCVDSYESGSVVTAGDRENITLRWPAFALAAQDSGYQSVHAVPLRLRQKTIGSLNFFSDSPGVFEVKDVLVAQTIADVATIGLVQEQAIREASLARAQLQHALDARIVIEQAKGIIAHSRNVDMESAWRTLRQYARSHESRVSDIAKAVVEGLVVL
ncbi:MULTISPECIES: GAF and ANTAR domain-containing protein [unclassified Rathayibacter]|uniref:GAF and ANTAR domain-containing protein n=1 Tax=unclassified Rathayibacter TaxID=2609250 RepID=UPI0010511FB6|nr:MULTISPECIES: GAF and ANTAR domain-containing protein [unclassified Rathayibacter]TCL77937.1 AmiR/NasT family two-component response regulator [Rathayibacter sp. PhB192]TCM23718.1 AmiR/NasT family two-component response regulator [Rathayibacter sp. PhB179]